MDKPSDGKYSRRDRLVGKLFGKDSGAKEREREKERERRQTNEDNANEISSFLNVSDRLTVTHPVPSPPQAQHAGLPALALDTSRVTRYPQAHDVGDQNALHAHQNLPHRAQSNSTQRRGNRNGHNVRFTDALPEVMGVGGDECETLVSEIGRMKRSRSVP